MIEIKLQTFINKLSRESFVNIFEKLYDRF